MKKQLAKKIRDEQESDHRRELRHLSDLTFIFLSATDGDVHLAERLLDQSIDLLFDGGVLSTWRYRLVINFVREGL